MGLSLEMRLFKGSDSLAPTMVYSTSSLNSSSYTRTVVPMLTRSVATSESSITRAVRMVFSRSMISASKRDCSFLASSYSAFSLKSPKPRAIAICSATSARRMVERYCSFSSSFFMPSTDTTVLLLCSCTLLIGFTPVSCFHNNDVSAAIWQPLTSIPENKTYSRMLAYYTEFVK